MGVRSRVAAERALTPEFDGGPGSLVIRSRRRNGLVRMSTFVAPAVLVTTRQDAAGFHQG
jgi:hypothetical protein